MPQRARKIEWKYGENLAKNGQKWPKIEKNKVIKIKSEECYIKANDKIFSIARYNSHQYQENIILIIENYLQFFNFSTFRQSTSRGWSHEESARVVLGDDCSV